MLDLKRINSMLVQYISIGILVAVIIGCFLNFKKTVIIWLPAQLLFNAQVALKYSPPAMSLTLGVNLFLLVYYFLFERKKKDRFNKEGFLFKGAMIFIFISYVVSTIFGIIQTTKGLNTMIKYFVSNFGAVFLAQRVLRDMSDIKFFIKSCFFVLLFITLLGVSEFVLQDNLFLDFVYNNSPQDDTTIGRMWYVPGVMQMRFGMIRCFSTFGIHIAFGTACVSYFWMMYMLVRKKWKFITMPMSYTISILLFAGVFLANSKSGYVGIVFVFLSLIPLSRIFNVKIILPLAIMVVILFVYFPEYLDNFASLFNSDLAEEGGGSTVEGRANQFAIAFKMFEMNPLIGNGPGSIGVLSQIGDNSDILGAESSWMQILPERGLLGAIAYIYMYISVFLKCKKQMPVKVIGFFLLSIFVMETATGLLNMAVWGVVLVAVYRIYEYNKVEPVAKILEGKK